MTRRWWLLGGFLSVGLTVALAIGVFASPFASSAPDGMSRVAIDEGFDHTEDVSPVEDPSPVGGYALNGVTNERVATGLAGGIGVVVTFALGVALFGGLRVVRQRGVAPRGIPTPGAASP
jgi:hypothetical protein